MQRLTRTQLTLYGRDGRRKYLAPSERLAFIHAARALPRVHLGTLCLVIAYTGCRISEALSLHASSIERTEGFIAIRCLKKRDKFMVREVPVPPWLILHLIDVHLLDMAEPDTCLWLWSRGYAWALIKGIILAAGIAHGPHATAKGLRHGFAINALRSGVPSAGHRGLQLRPVGHLHRLEHGRDGGHRSAHVRRAAGPSAETVQICSGKFLE